MMEEVQVSFILECLDAYVHTFLLFCRQIIQESSSNQEPRFGIGQHGSQPSERNHFVIFFCC